MKSSEGVGCLSPEVSTGDFWFGIAPFDDDIAHSLSGKLSFTLRTADTQAGGPDAGVKFSAVEGLTGASSAALDDIDTPAH